jgi:hypothetical protein
VATGEWVRQFWVNSETGAILAKANQAWLGETRDLGARWTQLAEASSPYVDHVVQAAPSSSLWRFCSFVSDGSSNSPTRKRSQDSGSAWIDRPGIFISLPCPIRAKGRPVL